MNHQVYPPTWAGLRYPWLRHELISYLDELSANDPRPFWRAEAARGLVSGIDQVIHFFLDDHEFDASAIGIILLDEHEVELMHPVLLALERIITDLPRGGDDDYAQHLLWPEVTGAARVAHDGIAPR